MTFLFSWCLQNRVYQRPETGWTTCFFKSTDEGTSQRLMEIVKNLHLHGENYTLLKSFCTWNKSWKADFFFYKFLSPDRPLYTATTEVVHLMFSSRFEQGWWPLQEQTWILTDRLLEQFILTGKKKHYSIDNSSSREGHCFLVAARSL